MTPRVMVEPSKPGAVAGSLPSLPELAFVVAVLPLSSLPLPPQAAPSRATATTGTSSLTNRPDRRFTTGSPLGWSVRERPGLEVRLDAQPHGGQPARLEE